MIQIDMEMPKTCKDCPFYEGLYGCPIVENIPAWHTEIIKKSDIERSEHCPLKEVKGDFCEKGDTKISDRGTIVKWFEFCRVEDKCSTDCPYWNDRYSAHECTKELAKDILTILTEQETKTGHWIVLDICANEGVYCSECHMKIFDRVTKPKEKLSRYCPHCGSRNEQFFRDGEVVFR